METQAPSAGLLVHIIPIAAFTVHIESDLIWQAPCGGVVHRPLDGKDSNCPGQNAMTQSFIATLKSENLCIGGAAFSREREVARSAIFSE